MACCTAYLRPGLLLCWRKLSAKERYVSQRYTPEEQRDDEVDTVPYVTSRSPCWASTTCAARMCFTPRVRLSHALADPR
jgi:hypothetical protein